MADVEKIALEKLTIDPEIQQRAEISEVAVAEYAESLDKLPPITVYHDSATRWVVKGFHRYHAHVKAGAKEIACEVVFGTKRDAILAAVSDNADHGLRRSVADKRKAVMTLVNDEEWSKRSANWLAETAKVSYSFVKGILDERRGRDGSSTGKDGKNYGNSRKPIPVPEPDDADDDSADSTGWEVDSGDEGDTEPRGVRPDGADDRRGAAVNSGEWTPVPTTVTASPPGSSFAMDREIEKHFGSLVRAVDAKGRMRPQDANWQEFHRETFIAINALGRRLEAWKSLKSPS